MRPRAWYAPAAVFLIVLIVSAGFALGGPQIGLPLGALAGAILLVVAVSRKPDEPIEPPHPADTAAHILVVIGRPVEQISTTEAVSRAIEAAELEARSFASHENARVRVLAPARIGFLDRWASDFRRARDGAQRNLVISVASLARAEIGAEARVGDDDLVQATEDQLRDFPATRVILVTGSPEEDRAGEKAAIELRRRLAVPLTRVISGTAP